MSGHFTAVGTNSQELPSLHPKDIQDWLKRFRKAIEPLRIRYYVVGEYGDDTERPHYHIAIFGYPGCLNGLTQFGRGRDNCCSVCNMVRDTWKYGNIYVGSLTPESASYICGYVTKKMTSKDDIRLSGRYPEFARMSRRPGLGLMAMDEVADVLIEYDLMDKLEDVPVSLRHGSKIMPLGRYLRSKLRVLMGGIEKAPYNATQEAEVQAMYNDYLKNKEATSFKKHLVEESEPEVRNQEARQYLFKQRRMV